jgi:hypothetical protein
MTTRVAQLLHRFLLSQANRMPLLVLQKRSPTRGLPDRTHPAQLQPCLGMPNKGGGRGSEISASRSFRLGGSFARVVAIFSDCGSAGLRRKRKAAGEVRLPRVWQGEGRSAGFCRAAAGRSEGRAASMSGIRLPAGSRQSRMEFIRCRLAQPGSPADPGPLLHSLLHGGGQASSGPCM